MATRDGLAQIWYTDANGVVTGYTPNADNVASAIIDTYNEHYGTDINIWTPETKNLQVGGTVPNWNAYEKIEMPIRRIAVNLSNPQAPYSYMVGHIEGDTFKILVNAANGLISYRDGLIIAYAGPTSTNASWIIQQLNNFNVEVSNVENEIVDYDINTYLPNWGEYEIFG